MTNDALEAQRRNAAFEALGCIAISPLAAICCADCWPCLANPFKEPIDKCVLQSCPMVCALGLGPKLEFARIPRCLKQAR
jgi:hypothetical protein